MYSKIFAGCRWCAMYNILSIEKKNSEKLGHNNHNFERICILNFLQVIIHTFSGENWILFVAKLYNFSCRGFERFSALNSNITSFYWKWMSNNVPFFVWTLKIYFGSHSVLGLLSIILTRELRKWFTLVFIFANKQLVLGFFEWLDFNLLCSNL